MARSQFAPPQCATPNQQADFLPSWALPHGLVCSLSFNEGKALDAVGHTAEAELAYTATARQSVGHDAGCFAKVGRRGIG